MSTEILELKKENALKAYREGSKADKDLLNRLYGKQLFANPLETLFNFEDVCAFAGVNPAIYEVSSSMTEDNRHNVFENKLALIYRVFNGDWKPDFANTNQKKWFPVFYYDLKKGFVLSDVRYLYAYTCVSSRLCAISEPVARHISTHFLKEWNDYLLS